MENNPFFIPSPLYKEFMLLDVIEKNPSITQRAMSLALNIAVSMVNSYLGEYEDKAFLKRKYKSAKSVEYHLTDSGIKRKKLLNIWYLNASQTIYKSAKNNILSFLQYMAQEGYKTIYLYGAGEMTEIILDVLQKDLIELVEVMGIIDDNPDKQGIRIEGITVMNLETALNDIKDGILISSYTHHQTMINNLRNKKIAEEKIIQFF